VVIARGFGVTLGGDAGRALRAGGDRMVVILLFVDSLAEALVW
jgi:hypothetical protein